MNITVYNKPRSVVKKQEVVQDLLWYDHKKGKLEKFSGGQLFFENEYDKDLQEYRLLPKVSQLFIDKKEVVTDKKSVEDWFTVYENYNNTDAKIVDNIDNGIVFDVPDKEVDDFLYSLDRENFRVEKE